jgi:hypothetical protein
MSDEPRAPEPYEPPAVEEVAGVFPTVSTTPGVTSGRGPEGA